MGKPFPGHDLRVIDDAGGNGKVEAGGGKVIEGPHEIPGGDFSMFPQLFS
jgi:predicted enzyme related to lactoylglutathione lyase